MDEGLKEMCKNSDAENLTNTATSPSKASGRTIRLFAKPILGDDGLLEEIKIRFLLVMTRLSRLVTIGWCEIYTNARFVTVQLW